MSEWGILARTWATLCVCMSVASVLLAMLCIGSPIPLVVKQKPSKDDRNKKMNTSFMNRKSQVTLKCGNILPKTEKLADVSYCKQQFRLCWDLRDVERLAYTQIYTAVDRINGNSAISREI